MKITKDTSIEDLVDNYSFAVSYLSEKGIRCIVCGEPIWGTLEEACEEKGFSQDNITNFVTEMNELAAKPEVKNQSQSNKRIDTEKL